MLAGSIARQRRPQGAEVRDALRHDWPLVEVTAPLVLILGMGVVGVLSDRAAIRTATLVALVELGAAGAYAARASGAGRPGIVVSAMIA